MYGFGGHQNAYEILGPTTASTSCSSRWQGGGYSGTHYETEDARIQRKVQEVLAKQAEENARVLAKQIERVTTRLLEQQAERERRWEEQQAEREYRLFAEWYRFYFPGRCRDDSMPPTPPPPPPSCIWLF